MRTVAIFLFVSTIALGASVMTMGIKRHADLFNSNDNLTTEEIGKAQLRKLEDIDEHLRDIEGLLNSIAENTRK
jgi:hypothetical protein